MHAQERRVNECTAEKWNQDRKRRRGAAEEGEKMAENKIVWELVYGNLKTKRHRRLETWRRQRSLAVFTYLRCDYRQIQPLSTIIYFVSFGITNFATPNPRADEAEGEMRHRFCSRNRKFVSHTNYATKPNSKEGGYYLRVYSLPYI